MAEYIEDVLDDGIFEHAIEKSNLKELLRAELSTNLKEMFEKAFSDSTLGVEFNPKTNAIDLFCYIQVGEGDVSHIKTSPLKETFDYSIFYDSLFGEPHRARIAGEFFQKVADRCFEIEKEDLEDE